ncbi:MAG: flavin reductase [Anaerolineae bacterium]|nr:flavin reductase [Anaerolineae bacterium]
MELKIIPFNDFLVKAHGIWSSKWLLLTAGDFTAGRFNGMTVGWGSLGIMWGKPFVQVVVRPTRYTFEFMEHYATFTLCTFPEQYRKALQIMGTKSGRDGDKIAEAGLTPVASIKVAAPAFAEADLIIECRKIYWDDLDPTHFLSVETERHYAQKDYHRVYYGEIEGIWENKNG